MENSQETKQPLIKKEHVVPIAITVGVGLASFMLGRKIGRNQGVNSVSQALLNKDPDLWMKVTKVFNEK